MKKKSASLSPEEIAIENDNSFQSIGRDPYEITSSLKNFEMAYFITIPVSKNTFSRVSEYAKSRKTTASEYIGNLVETL